MCCELWTKYFSTNRRTEHWTVQANQSVFHCCVRVNFVCSYISPHRISVNLLKSCYTVLSRIFVKIVLLCISQSNIFSADKEVWVFRAINKQNTLNIPMRTKHYFCLSDKVKSMSSFDIFKLFVNRVFCLFSCINLCKTCHWFYVSMFSFKFPSLWNCYFVAFFTFSVEKANFRFVWINHVVSTHNDFHEAIKEKLARTSQLYTSIDHRLCQCRLYKT